MALPSGMTQQYYDELIEDIDTLKKAIRTGVKECYYGDKRVVYDSYTDMRRRLNAMLEEAGLKKPDSNRTYASVSMGFNSRCNRRGEGF